MNVKKRYIYISVISILLLVFVAVFLNSPYRTARSAEIINIDPFIVTRFDEFSNNGNVFCFGTEALMKKSDSETLKGSCCDEMSLHRYSEQIEGLKKYPNKC